MSESEVNLFPGERLGEEVLEDHGLYSGGEESREDLIYQISDIHSELRKVLEDEWQMKVYSGDRAWDFEARYKGSKGDIVIKGRPEGEIEVEYSTDQLAEMPDEIDETVENLNYNLGRPMNGVSPIVKDHSSIKVDMNREIEIDRSGVSRYLRDVISLYASADDKIKYPSVDLSHS